MLLLNFFLVVAKRYDFSSLLLFTVGWPVPLFFQIISLHFVSLMNYKSEHHGLSNLVYYSLCTCYPEKVLTWLQSVRIHSSSESMPMPSSVCLHCVHMSLRMYPSILQWIAHMRKTFGVYFPNQVLFRTLPWISMYLKKYTGLCHKAFNKLED